jgi:hypothetical protein
MADVSNIVQYYADLLIIQYNGKPKASATIKTMVDIILQNGILLDVLDAFNPDTCVGKQQDILGKWVGVDRYYLGDGTTQILNDDDYRIVLNFRAITNSLDMNCSAIDNILYEFFGNNVICTTDNDLRIFYLVTDEYFNISSILLQKKVLPKPIGVAIGGIIKSKVWFGFSTYETFNKDISANVAGFATYANWLTKKGSFLTYNDIYNS